MTGMIAAPIRIASDSFICVVVVIYNLKEKRLYLHESFLTEKIPEIAASSLVHSSNLLFSPDYLLIFARQWFSLCVTCLLEYS